MSAGNLPDSNSDAKMRLQRQICGLGLPAELADDVIGHHTLVNYGKGAMVILQGSPADVLFYVIAGVVKVYSPSPDGGRILLKLAGPGDLVGYADYVDSRGRRAQIFEVEALTKTSVALLTREHILKILSTFERTTLLQVIEGLNTAWSSMAQSLGTFLGMSFKERLELVLKELGTKFGVRDSRGILLTPELAHADFAEMIGSSRPMVTRLMAEMTKEGLLLRQGKRFILCEPFVNKHARVAEEDNAAAFAPPSRAPKGSVQNAYRQASVPPTVRNPGMDWSPYSLTVRAADQTNTQHVVIVNGSRASRSG
jgi:CRP/FNR family transcriptional regulator, cyclic AMP receptor protein